MKVRNSFRLTIFRKPSLFENQEYSFVGIGAQTMRLNSFVHE